MKKVIAALLSFILAAVFSGCTGSDISSGFSLLSPENKEKTFTVEDYGLTFRTPTGWVEDMEDTELDYFVTNISAGLGIFGFYRSDFTDDAEPEDIFRIQNDSTLEAYDNVQKLEHESTFEASNKTITAELYSAEFELEKIYVYFTLVEFPERDEFFWTIITASPSYARKHFDEFDDIIDSFDLEEADSGSAGSSSENGSAI